LSLTVRLDGRPVEPADAEIIEVEPGVFSVLAGGNSWEVRVLESEIAVGAHRFTYEIDDPRQWKQSGHSVDTHGRSSVQSAMPGKVIRILVAVGDEVTAGQGIMVVEAMKMQNELKSPRAGKVTSIEVKANDSVNAGAILATIE
jgi:biotin carboxyl carrier protein